jgi:acetate kinase
MKILVINCGSSSLKYSLFDMDKEAVLAKGLIERIGEAHGARCKHKSARGKHSAVVAAPDHEAALNHMVRLLTDPETGVIKSLDEIGAVGHRVVHGGEAFADSTKVDEKVMAVVAEQAALAPLHNPPNLMGIRAARKVFTHAPHVAVFDTAFHETMPPKAFLYGIPYELYEKRHVRRYGFHGTSHRFVGRRAAEILGKPFERFTGITCHLGNGCSLAAIKEGKSVDTTMGLTPLEGLMMGTRSGDIDAALVFFLNRQAEMTVDQIDSMLNRKSGLLGVSGVSNDMRTLIEAAEKGNRRAKLALEMFAYRVRKYIGAYLAVLNGADAVVFTGGIGERDPAQREMICSGLENLGIEMDKELNARIIAQEALISAPGSRIKVMVVPTNEELEIARETLEIAK